MKNEQEITRLLNFYGILERPLTLLEIRRLLPHQISLQELLDILGDLTEKGKITEIDGFYSVREQYSVALCHIEKRKWQDFLLDRKWKKLGRLRFFFSLLPFTHFIFVSGSLALQNVHKTSDFDVLVGCREKRIFTVRFLSVALFGLLGVRRKRVDHKISANNKVCLNHFVTPATYKLSPPYSIYWEQLYINLIPFVGSEPEVKRFWEANKDLAKKDIQISNRKFKVFHKPVIIKFFEFIFKGFLGDIFELLLKIGQTYYRKSHLSENEGYKPRIIYSDEELELHTDTRRIEEIIKKIGG